MIRTAIFGLGKVVEQIHLPACLSVSDIQVVAACEPVAARRDAMKERFGIPAVYADARTLVETEKPDLVIVATPPVTHYELSLLALENGAHVLCEKPFMRSLSEADDIIAAADQHHRLLVVNNQYRFMATYHDTKQRLEAGEFGRPYFIQCWQQMYHPANTDATPWRADLKQSTLYEFGSHALDLMSFFFDDLPETVTAIIPRVRLEYDSDVLVQMTLQFPEDRLATLAFNRVSRAPERYLEMRVDCDEASLRLSLGGVARASVGMNRADGRLAPSARFSYVRGGEARAEAGGRSRVIARESNPAFASATATQLRQMIIDMQQPALTNAKARHSREILRTIFAGYESNRQRTTVAVSDITLASIL
ncbi:MAG: Gfo/Idh/MocA family oxidoreductase [Anaerolineae bacterium]|nr:Gfo/Idh/MocA family oxidoreductase [Anaerolineae bacterium]